MDQMPDIEKGFLCRWFAVFTNAIYVEAQKAVIYRDLM